MADNQYITIMIQSLQKKEKVLNSIIQINKRQKEELENPSLDPDDFDKTVEEKSEPSDAGQHTCTDREKHGDSGAGST